MEPVVKILIVDDNEQNLTLLHVILQRHGYDIRLSQSGEEALQQIVEDPPDLIILDVMMPGMDGIEVCQRLKDNVETRLIPIVIMTALNQPEDKIRGIEAGADDFLTKLVNQAELIARVRTSLKLKQTMDHKVRELVHIKGHFAKFVPLAVRRLVEENPEAPELEKRDRDVSVLFLDMSGYTSLSQELTPAALNTLINAIFRRFWIVFTRWMAMSMRPLVTALWRSFMTPISMCTPVKLRTPPLRYWPPPRLSIRNIAHSRWTCISGSTRG